MPLFDAEFVTRWRHSYSGILILTHVNWRSLWWLDC